MRSFVRAAEGHTALGIRTTAGDWVEYFGEGVLQGGRAEVSQDELLLQTVAVNESYPVEVLIQLHDERCQGVAAKKSQSTLTVVEFNDGRSNSTFDYRVVARRKGYEDARLEVRRNLPSPLRMNPFETRSE